MVDVKTSAKSGAYTGFFKKGFHLEVDISVYTCNGSDYCERSMGFLGA